MKYLAGLGLVLVSLNVKAVCNQQAEALISAYPDFLSRCENNRLIWQDGDAQIFDDGRQKNAKQLLEDADIQDMFVYPYPLGVDSYRPPALDRDAGRIRNEAFFKKMYGATAQEVEAHLVTIEWMPQSKGKPIRISSVNGIDKKLAKISAELDELPPELKKYVLSTSGTFNWRTISGTKRLSGHSFGIALDINAKFSDYWQWAGKNYRYHNAIPSQIVEIFEKYGFIWGGKWYHYDTMHFEYRPELLGFSQK